MERWCWDVITSSKYNLWFPSHTQPWDRREYLELKYIQSFFSISEEGSQRTGVVPVQWTAECRGSDTIWEEWRGDVFSLILSDLPAIKHPPSLSRICLTPVLEHLALLAGLGTCIISTGHQGAWTPDYMIYLHFKIILSVSFSIFYCFVNRVFAIFFWNTYKPNNLLGWSRHTNSLN